MSSSSTASPTARVPADWMPALERDVVAHRAVRHPLLARLADDRAALVTFGRQHVALVGCFTKYMEWLLLRAPSSSDKLWLAKVLVDEYGEGTDGDDHDTLYRRFLASLGVPRGAIDDIALLDEVGAFVDAHVAMCRREPFLVGLGALGPGHEWAIPTMFSAIVPALEAHGVAPSDGLYFTAHQEQDVDHGAWMSEALARLVRTADDERLVRRGALASLELRASLWDAIERLVDGDQATSPNPDATIGALVERVRRTD